MSKQSRALLKTWFETGDTPTQAQFIDLIDSYVNINDDLVTSGTILFKAFTAQVAQLLTLNSAPLEIIAAPGAGKAIVPIYANARMVFVATPYATNTDPRLIIDTADDIIMTLPFGWLASNANSFVTLQPQGGNVSLNQLVENKALLLKELAGDPTAGDSLVELFILYQVVSV